MEMKLVMILSANIRTDVLICLARRRCCHYFLGSRAVSYGKRKGSHGHGKGQDIDTNIGKHRQTNIRLTPNEKGLQKTQNGLA